VTINLKLPPHPPRLPYDLEIALFRVLEEALANIYRHSQASKADIALAQQADRVQLTVRDYGRGIAAEDLRTFHAPTVELHLGLAGLRERVEELGGEFTVERKRPGTLLRASLPIPKPNT
jgi:two-component system, NarL family, sensor kinase